MDEEKIYEEIPVPYNIWQLNIKEITGVMIEASGRTRVNRLLKNGWILLHMYTLTYKEDGIWRERPMAILGRSTRNPQKQIAPDIRLTTKSSTES